MSVAVAVRLAVPGRVADQHRLVGAGLLQRRKHQVGFWFGLGDVGGGRPPVGQPTGVEQVQIAIDLVGLGRAPPEDNFQPAIG